MSESMFETYQRVDRELREYVRETARLPEVERHHRMRYMLPNMQDDVLAEMARLEAA